MELIIKVSKLQESGLRAVCDLGDGNKLIALAKDWDELEWEAMRTIRAEFTKEELKAITSIRMEWDSSQAWTLAQYEENIDYYEEIRSGAVKNICEIKKKYLAMSPFKEGDKVRVTHKVVRSFAKGGGAEIIETEAFIKSVRPGSSRYRDNGDYDYAFSEVKKDGKQSSRILYITRVEKIEKIC